MEWFIKAQRQQKVINEKYTAKQREEEEAEEAAIRRRVTVGDLVLPMNLIY